MSGVHLLALGGTISMIDTPKGARPALSARELSRHAAAIVAADDVALLGGSEVGFEVLQSLAGRIDHAVQAGATGIVVTMGTDAIEEASTWLAFVHRWPVPIVVTGSMLPGGRPDTDAFANLSDAAAVAAVAPAIAPLVVFAGNIFEGVRTVKVSGVGRNAFDSPGHGPVGVVLAGQPVIHRLPMRLPTVGLPRLPISPVPIVIACMDDDGALFRHAASEHRAVVVAANGAGNLPPKLAQAVRAVARDVLIIVTSRSPDATTAPLYGYPGGSAELAAAGVLQADGFSAHRARILALLALGSGQTVAQCRLTLQLAIRELSGTHTYDPEQH